MQVEVDLGGLEMIEELDQVLQRAADVGAAVLRTDELGTIEVTTDGQAMWWEAHNN